MHLFIKIFLTAGLAAGLLACSGARLEAAETAKGGSFRMLDAIEQFGEQRYVRSGPARIKMGPAIFHPTLTTEIEYDDNILLGSSDAREDIIFDIRPGTLIEIPINQHQLVVGYEADFEVFTKRNKESDQNQTAFALVDLNFPNWYINVLERFRETSTRSGTTFTGRIPRYDQMVNPKIGYRWKRMTVEGQFRHLLRDYRRQVDDPLDYEVSEWSGVVYFDLFPRLKTLVEYNFAQIDYDDDYTRNGAVNQFRVGLDGQLLPNLNAQVKVGAQLRNYEVPAKPDFRSWVGNIKLEYDMRDNLHFELEGNREAVEATTVGINFFVEHLVRFGFEYEFLPKWTLFSDFQYFKHNYQERQTSGTQVGFRRDDHVFLSSGFRYLFREWWEFEAAYEFRRRDSNFPQFDYTDNRFSLTSSVFY